MASTAPGPGGQPGGGDQGGRGGSRAEVPGRRGEDLGLGVCPRSECARGRAGCWGAATEPGAARTAGSAGGASGPESVPGPPPAGSNGRPCLPGAKARVSPVTFPAQPGRTHARPRPSRAPPLAGAAVPFENTGSHWLPRPRPARWAPPARELRVRGAVCERESGRATPCASASPLRELVPGLAGPRRPPRPARPGGVARRAPSAPQRLPRALGGGRPRGPRRRRAVSRSPRPRGGIRASAAQKPGARRPGRVSRWVRCAPTRSTQLAGPVRRVTASPARVRAAAPRTGAPATPARLWGPGSARPAEAALPRP